ncbi:MAG TPA: cytidylate kinase-like family protein [Holophaga sp.]|nr:cytidylate kinase-like family protein [Holophaga sp.]HPS67034.1 cytidylate kinase-like family protein [Holophaga sp.]
MTKPFSSLTPSVEHRLSAWEQIQYRLTHQDGPRIRPTITLSRQFGCEGFALAERVKALFEEASGEAWNIYDKALVEQVARDEAISLRLLRNLGDMSHALEALGLHPATHVTHDKAFEKVAESIVQIATVGNAVIVGRGGSILCRGMKNCYHFRLEASLAWRVESIVKRLEMPREEAEAFVKTNAKLREKFISHSLGEDITELRHYDAVFNNERHSANEMAAAILAYVRSAWPGKGYFRS